MIYEALRYEGDDQLPQLLDSYKACEEVGLGDWKISSGGLLTRGVSSCIALAAHNGATRKGLLGHFNSITAPKSRRYSGEKKFHEALSAIDLLGEPASTEVWLGGGRPLLEGSNDIVRQDREFAQQKVREHLNGYEPPSSQLKVDWSDPERIIDVELDCETGILIVHNTSKAQRRVMHVLAQLRKQRSSGESPD
jgi:hypothetical protein